MIRIYYSPTNGDITRSVTAKNAPRTLGDDWIEVAEEIKINEWRVDIANQCLVRLPDEEIVQPIVRNF